MKKSLMENFIFVQCIWWGHTENKSFLKAPEMFINLITFFNLANNVLHQMSQYLKKMMKFITKLDKEKKNKRIFKRKWPTIVKDKNFYY